MTFIRRNADFLKSARSWGALGLFLALAVISSTSQSTYKVVAQTQTVTIILNTGYDNTSQSVIPTGGLDDDWRVIVDPVPNSPPTPRPANVVGAYGAQHPSYPIWAQPFANSQWISAASDSYEQLPPTTLFTYELCFSLPAGFSNPQLNVQLRADDMIDQVHFGTNAFPGSTTAGGFNTSQPPLVVTTTTGFFPGSNCLTVEVRDTGGGPTGLLVAGTVTYDISQTTGCVQPPSGLEEWWPLDETSGNVVNNLIAHPIAGHGPDLHNGTPQPGPITGTGPAPVAGMVGGALQFDGVDDFVEVPDGSGTLSHGNPTSNFTIDAWIKVDPNDKSGIRPIVDKRFDFPDTQNPNVHTRGYAFFLSNGQLGFQLFDDMVAGPAGLNPICDGGPPFTANCTNYVSPVDVADGNWHHVAVTVQRTGTPEVKLYVDGNLVFTRGARTGNANSSIPLLIGSGYPIVIPKPFFKGAIDEVEIFNRALSEDEIKSIFNAGSAGKCKVTADLGDAPDSTNHSGKAMDAYPSVTAKFPTVFDPTTGTPQGPKHLQPKGLAWLGPDVSFENEADLLPDADGITNIDPSTNAADRDKFDDGVVLPIAIPMICGQTQFKYTVTSTVAAKLYVNVWFDFNRDGDWDDPIQKCPLGPAITGSFTEWAVQNELITVTGPGTFTFTAPVFGAANPTKGSDMWMRITLTDQPIAPANGADGSGPAGGYKYGETEDYLLKLQYTELCGIKFNDLNGNGQQDAGEPGLANWVIEVKDANGNFIGFAVTDANGKYCIVVPVPGTYTVSEQQQAGWTQTAPLAPGTYTVTVPPAHTDLNFGNQQVGKCDLAIKKSVNPNPVQSGQQVTVTLTVQNVGNAPCGPDTVVQDPPTLGLTVPSQTVAISQSGGSAAWFCSILGGGVNCVTASTLPAGYTATFTFTATVTAPPGSQIQNCAEVTNVGDANQANNKSCVTINVTGIKLPPDLALAKLLDGQLRVEQEATYVLRVANGGRGPTTSPIVVSDPLPAQLRFVSASGPGWSCSAQGQNVTCRSAGPIAPGQTSTILLRVRVAAPAGTQITNCATVTTEGDANPANNRACHTGTVQR